MTGKELIEALSQLDEFSLNRPVLIIDEVWLKEVDEITLELENEYGVGPDDLPHIRLHASSLKR